VSMSVQCAGMDRKHLPDGFKDKHITHAVWRHTEQPAGLH
jgi:hypothetical protein